NKIFTVSFGFLAQFSFTELLDFTACHGSQRSNRRQVVYESSLGLCYWKCC
ncbi:hypothetical protein RYX36_026670, partial [Vicia faba]